MSRDFPSHSYRQVTITSSELEDEILRIEARKIFSGKKNSKYGIQWSNISNSNGSSFLEKHTGWLKKITCL